MNEMILLGAGASVEAHVPTAFTMTEKIVSNLRSNPRFEKQSHALSYVVGGLLFEAGKNNVNPLEPAINVEDLFNAVQLLAERKTLEAAPFIGSWHSFLEELDKIYPSQPSGNLQRLIYDAVAKEILSAFSQTPPSFGSRKIDQALATTIKKAIDAAVNKRSTSLSSIDGVGTAVEHYIKELTSKWSSKLKCPSMLGSNKIESQIRRQILTSQSHSGEGQIFHQTTELMIAALKDLVWIEDTSKVTYLAPLLNALSKQGRLVVATLNYDNSLELLSTSQNVTCHTGISDWSTQGRFDVSSEGLHLLKLHGSIDWLREYDETSTGRMPIVKIRQLAPQEVKRLELRPAVIFGNRNKLTAEGPFLDLLRAFQEELADSLMLTVIGYSFRDPHINVYISQWLNGNATRVLRIVNGENFNLTSDTAPYLRDLLRFTEANPQRVQIVAENASAGLTTLYGNREIVVSKQKHASTQPALERIAEEAEAIENLSFNSDEIVVEPTSE